METVYQHADRSKLNFNVLKEQPLFKVWNSLWEQCEEANEKLQSLKGCFAKPNKSIYNVMKMLAVFQTEVKRRSVETGYSDSRMPGEDMCECCGSSNTKQKLLKVNYERRGEMIEYLLSQSVAPVEVDDWKHPTGQSHQYNEDLDEEEPGCRKGNSFRPMSTIFPQEERYTQKKQTQFKEKTTKTLIKLLSNFTKYDPCKDPLTNMSVFENECSQHNLGPRESCLMMKLWLPSHMSVRLASPVATPACGPQFWSNDDHWGDTLDRLKALTCLVTGEEDLGFHILEDLKFTPQDDPWVFAWKFEQAYRLLMGVKDADPPPAMLKALVNKFTSLDCATHIAACQQKTVSGIVKIVDRYLRVQELKKTRMGRYQFSPCISDDGPENLQVE